MTTTQTSAPRYTATRDGDEWVVIGSDESRRECSSRKVARELARELNAVQAEADARSDADPDAGVAVEPSPYADVFGDETVTSRSEVEARYGADEADGEFQPEDDPEHQAFLAMSPAEQSTELVRLAREAEDDYVGPDGLGAREDDDEVLVPSAEEEVARQAAQAEAEQVAAEHEQVERDAAAEAARVILDQPADVPVAEAVAKVQRTGESVLARKMVAGQRVQLRGVGVVDVTEVAKIKGQQKVLVKYTCATGEGERELWINSRYSIVA